MGQAIVLYVGRSGGKDQSYVEALQKRYILLMATSGKQGADLLDDHYPEVIVLDAPSMRTHGERICRQLRVRAPKIPILHIIPGDAGDIESPAELLLPTPFTSRKLLSNVERLMKARSDEVIACGPFKMNVPRRLLTAHGQDVQLTPKAALLVELFLRNPNQTFDRKMLMESIWQTDYMGDTRTLDVHIRWVRKALENGGSHRYLQTVRGVGYRLVLPANASTSTAQPELVLAR